MSKDLNILARKVGEKAAAEILHILKVEKAILTITRDRVSRHGDYRLPRPGEPHRMSLNGNLGANQFLLTFLHEYAHLLAFKEFGKEIKPHGTEWKRTFSNLLYKWVQKGAFVEPVAIELLRHAQNPTASTLSDGALYEAVKLADQSESRSTSFLKDLKEGAYFYLKGNYFLKGAKRRTRYVCKEVATRRDFLVHEMAEVVQITNTLNP
jgi:hypothetical protein